MSIIAGAALIVIGTLLINAFLRGNRRRQEAAASRSMPQQQIRMEARCQAMGIPTESCLAYAERPKVPALPVVCFILAAATILPDLIFGSLTFSSLHTLGMGFVCAWYGVYHLRIMREAYFIVTGDKVHVHDLAWTCRSRSYTLPADNILNVTLVHHSINEIATSNTIRLRLRSSMGYPVNRKGFLILGVEPHAALSAVDAINALVQTH